MTLAPPPPPEIWPSLVRRTADLGFGMPSDEKTGALLRSLAASKPGGRFLELGTGTGLATAWLIDGMDAAARLVTIDVDDAVLAVARDTFGNDRRVEILQADAEAWLRTAQPGSFDLVFADAMPGKYVARAEALGLVKPGGFYVGDDMLPQANWPEGHQARVDEMVSWFRRAPDWALVTMDWGSGLLIATRVSV